MRKLCLESSGETSRGSSQALNLTIKNRTLQVYMRYITVPGVGRKGFPALATVQPMRDNHSPANEKPLHLDSCSLLQSLFSFPQPLPMPPPSPLKKSVLPFVLPFLLQTCLWFCWGWRVPNYNSLLFPDNPIFAEK